MEKTEWDDKIDYLEQTRGLLLNADYWAFLVRQVWKLDRQPLTVMEFGCGYGDVGLKLLPLLAAGSDYIGFDQGPLLLEQARERFARLPYEAEFRLADINELEGEGQADAAICQAVLLHMPDPLETLRRMTSFVKPGGWVIAIEPYWNSAMAGQYYPGLDPELNNTLGILYKLYELDRRRTGKDGNIGLKLPVLMHRLGLAEVECRVSDRVNFLHAGLPARERDLLFHSLSADGLGRVVGDQAAYVSRLVERGLTVEEAERLYRSEHAMTEYFREQGITQGALFAPSMMITAGRVKGV